MSDPITMLDSDGNPLAVGMAVLWKGHGRREFRPGWVRDIVIDNGKPSARIDDGAEWDGDLNGRTWSMAEWVTDPRKIRPRREQPLPDPRIAALDQATTLLRAALPLLEAAAVQRDDGDVLKRVRAFLAGVSDV